MTAVAKKSIDAVDPITTEVIRRRLVAIADEVDVNITRTAFSPYIYEYKDYAVGIVDGNGDLVCQCSAGIPIFVADVMRSAVLDGLALYGRDQIHHGDIIFTNYAGTVGQHLNNVVMYTPVFSPERPEIVAFMVVVMHWIDVGGRDVGSTSKFATDIFQEGVQFRTVKLFSEGKPVDDMFRMIRHNTRFPVEVGGDINSQIGGCMMGRDAIASLVGRYGTDTFRNALDQIWDQSEKAAREVIRQLPDGVYTAEAFLDDDGLIPDKPLPLRVSVQISGDDFIVDMSGVAGEANSPINSGISGGGQTVARLAFRYLITPTGDANEGTFRPLKLVLPEGTLVSAKPTAAMGHYNVPLPTLIDLIIRALEPVMPERVAAGHFGSFSTVAFAGPHPATGKLFQCNDSGFGGWGALCDQDGPGPFRTMCHGDTRLIPIEVHEASYPLRIENFELRADSGGAGEFRGGLGLRREYSILSPCRLATRFERTKSPPWGMKGGEAGAIGNVVITSPDGSSRKALKEAIQLKAGDHVLVETGGGGGFGDPRLRTRQRIAEDVRLGYISVQAATAHYGYNDADSQSAS